MSASFQFYQTYGVAPGTDVPQGTGAGSNDWDFKRVDVAGPVTDGPTQGIYAGDFSMHVYVRGKFSQPTDGSPNFTSIDNVRFYASNLNLSGCGTGAYILASGTSVYAEPKVASKSGVWDTVPLYAASGLDVGTSGLALGFEGWTDWIGLQLKTMVNGAGSGYSAYSSFTITWDEI